VARKCQANYRPGDLIRAQELISRSTEPSRREVTACSYFSEKPCESGSARGSFRSSRTGGPLGAAHSRAVLIGPVPVGGSPGCRPSANAARSACGSVVLPRTVSGNQAWSSSPTTMFQQRCATSRPKARLANRTGVSGRRGDLRRPPRPPPGRHQATGAPCYADPNKQVRPAPGAPCQTSAASG
jgi:hypothetical protein